MIIETGKIWWAPIMMKIKEFRLASKKSDTCPYKFKPHAKVRNVSLSHLNNIMNNDEI